MKTKAQTGDGYILLVFQGDRPVGANLINGLPIAGRLKTAMTRRINLLEHLPLSAEYLQPDELDRVLFITGHARTGF